KSRLEQLDELAEDTSSKEADFAAKVDEINSCPAPRLWDEDQRVRATKLVIQCVKLLGDSTPSLYYPSKFVLLTDLLDTFGNLVFDRLAEKGQRWRQAAPGFRSNSCQKAPKRRPRIGFTKSLRFASCYPRLYVEAALLPCYRFVDDRLIGPAIGRLGASSLPARARLACAESGLDIPTLARGDPLRRLLLDAEPCLLAACLAALCRLNSSPEESVAIGNGCSFRQAAWRLADPSQRSWPIPSDGDRESALALLNSAWGAVRSANPRPGRLFDLFQKDLFEWKLPAACWTLYGLDCAASSPRRQRAGQQPGLFLCRLLHDSLTVVSLETIDRRPHGQELSAFTHACAAFSFFTLPSLDEPGTAPCQLYLESAAALTLLTGTCVNGFVAFTASRPLDNLATAPTGQQAQQQHQRRRLRDLRLGLLCGLADHCDLTAPDTAALFGQLWQLTAASIDGGGDVQQARATLAQLRDRARGVAGGWRPRFAATE
uniref:TLDc domain-containing protein n=1 Tax=Macrostomum lignano TaxID=282301 RepID=A0A1I8F9L3_9PLAT